MFTVYKTCASVIRFSGKQNKMVTTMTIVVIITIDMQDYKSMPQESRLHEFCLPPLLLWAYRKAVTKGRMLQNCKIFIIIQFSNICNQL